MFYDLKTRFKSLKPFIQWRVCVLVERATSISSKKKSWVSNEGSRDSPAPQLKTLLEEEIKFIESRSRSEIKMSDLDLKEI